MVNKLSLLIIFFCIVLPLPQHIYATSCAKMHITNTQSDELVIPFDTHMKYGLQRFILVEGLMLALTSWMLRENRSPNSLLNLYMITSSEKKSPSNLVCLTSLKFLDVVARFIQMASGITLPIHLYNYINMNENYPMAVLNKKGIDINKFAFISWNAIEEMKIIEGPTPAIKAVAIQLKSNFLSEIYNQSSLQRKSTLLIMKLLRYKYHIFLSSLSFPMDEVIDFAKRFIPQKIKESQQK